MRIGPPQGTQLPVRPSIPIERSEAGLSQKVFDYKEKTVQLGSNGQVAIIVSYTIDHSFELFCSILYPAVFQQSPYPFLGGVRFRQSGFWLSVSG
jgi:hypothetical protein